MEEKTQEYRAGFEAGLLEAVRWLRDEWCAMKLVPEDSLLAAIEGRPEDGPDGKPFKTIRRPWERA